MKYLLLVSVLSLFVMSCEKDILLQTEAEDLVVLEAFLYAGEPVDDIYLTALLPYDDTDSVIQVISDAEIMIIHNDTEYLLIPSDSVGFYHYPGADLEVVAGDTYQIEFTYFGKKTSAETTVPVPTTGIIISDTEVIIDEGLLQSNPREFIQSLPQIEVDWDDGAGDYFYVLVKNVEDNPENIDFGQIGARRGNFRFVSRPQPVNSYRLQPFIIQQYGTHKVEIFRVNKEYADLYESTDQDSRNLNEPATNVTNGLGVFTAFSSGSINFEVSRQ